KALRGQLLPTLNLEHVDDATAIFERLQTCDDGTPESQMRLALAEFAMRTRLSTFCDICDLFETNWHLVDRVRDPLLRSSFHTSYAYSLIIAGRYSEALRVARESEQAAKEDALLFVQPHTQRLRAVAEF